MSGNLNFKALSDGTNTIADVETHFGYGPKARWGGLSQSNLSIEESYNVSSVEDTTFNTAMNFINVFIDEFSFSVMGSTQAAAGAPLKALHYENLSSDVAQFPNAGGTAYSVGGVANGTMYTEDRVVLGELA